MKKTRDLLIIALSLAFIFMSISNVVVAHDIHHLQTCHEENCEICSMIRIAQNSLNIISLLIVVSILGYLFSYILKKLKSKRISSNSLVNSCVQFNE